MANKDCSKYKVAILLAFYEGYEYFDEQIVSILNQTHKNLEIWISNDSENKKKSNTFLKSYKKKYKSKIHLIDGPKKGNFRNFLYLACKAEIQANFYAFCDQDDIWEANKLEVGIDFLRKSPHIKPRLFCSRTLVVDSYNRKITKSPLWINPPSFSNAIVQNIAGGNTMIFNNQARDLIISHGYNINIVMHDWWLYILVSGAGGVIEYCSEPLVRYRQHSSNAIGENNSLKAKIKRFIGIFLGDFSAWNRLHINQLISMPKLLTKNNREIVKGMKSIQSVELLERLKIFKRIGVTKQTKAQNLVLLISVIFGIV